jgi:VWFA-related protein
MFMKRYFCLLLLFLAITLFLTSPVFCQSASQGTSAAGKLRFAVVVSDSHDAPIRDLHSDDFVIEVAGKPQPGEVLSPAAQATAGGANNGRGLVVVVIDTIHTIWREESDVRADAVKYVAACAKRDEPVSLLVLDSERALIPVHEYTTSSATLAAALERVDAEKHHRTPAADASPEVVAEAGRFVDFFKGAGKFASPRLSRAYPAAILDGFSTVARYVAGIPGRKSLIWINNIFPFAVEEKQGRIASPTAQYGDHVEPLVMTEDEVNHLQTKWKASIAAAQRSELALFPVLARHTSFTPDREVAHSMESMARMTGGREVHLVGDPFVQFQELAQDNAAAYDVVLPAEAARDCKSDWCELRITVKRSGAHVLAPEGFFRDASVLPPETSVAAVRLPGEPDPGPNPIPFTVTWKPAEGAGPKKKVAFVVNFAPTAGVPAAGSAELNLQITVHAIANKTDKQAMQFGAKSQLPAATLDQIRAKGFALNNSIDLEPGDYDVRFVVQDKISGRSGILSVPLKVS